MKTLRARLGVEALEDRRLLAVFGTAWPDPGRMTLSFPADGTAVGAQQSTLFQTLDAQLSTRAWQLAVLRAFQTWAVNANINIGLVSDGGQALGSTGPLQGDERFGDIRLTARALDQAALAVATPFDVTAGTWSGDATLNSNYDFGPDPGQFDVFTVLLHEAGHVYGIGGSTDPNSAMYQQYRGVRTGLSTADIRDLQTLYGQRLPDAHDAREANDTAHRATHIDYDYDGQTITTTIVGGDITTTRDIDWYRFDVDDDITSFTLTVQTSGISLLASKLTVYDEDMELVDAVFATDPLSGDVSIVLGDVHDGRFWLKVEGATNNVFGIGGYELRVTPGTDDGDDGEDDYLNDDHGGDDDFETAAILPQQYRRADLRFDYSYQASLSAAGDVDFYRIRAPQTAGGATNVMSVMAWGLEADGLEPTVQVYNRRMKPVEARVLVNENGAFTLQVVGVQSNRDYFVAVHAAAGTQQNLGNYFVGIDFGVRQVKLPTVENATLTAGNRQVVRTLEVNQAQLVHLTLTATGGSVASGVRLTVYDLTGRVVHTFIAESGKTQTTTLLLQRGSYAFHFAGGTRDGSAFLPLGYRLRVLGLSDPIGPQPIDTTLQPTSPTNPPSPTGPGTVWTNFGLYAFLSMSGPYSSPW